MPTGEDIPNRFFVPVDDFECIIDVTICGKNAHLMKYIMDKIEFNIPPSECEYEFHATPPYPNTTTLSRKIFVKKKIDLKKSF